MNVIIIGSRGFLGSHLVDHYENQGHRVFTLTFRPERHRDFVLDFKNTMIKIQPELVINAGASQNGKDDTYAIEELISSNVLLPVLIASIILQTKSTALYINFGTSWQIGENGNSEPFNAYAASKASNHPFFDHFALSGLRIATLILYDTYGPNDSRNKVVNLIADSLIYQTELSMSSCEQVIDLVFIKDVLSAIDFTVSTLKECKNGKHKVFSIRSGKPIKILDLISLMKHIANIRNSDFIKIGINPYRARERFSLFEGTSQPPNWTPSFTLEQGLRLTIEDRMANRRFKK